MRRKSLVMVAVVAAAFAGYMLRRAPIPAPVSGGEPAQPTTIADARIHAVIARFKAQDELAASAVPVSPATVAVPATVPSVSSPDPNDAAGLRAIDAWATGECQRIEAWYSNELAGLKAQLEQRLERLKGADRLAWAQFRQRVNETWSTTSGYSYASAQATGSGSVRDYGYSSETTATYVPGDPAGEYAAIMARIRDSRQVTQQDFLKAQESLAWARKEKLAAVQREADRQRSYIRNEAARRSSGDPTPKVEAVVAGADNRFCALIGDGLVSEGDTVQGYYVRKIRTDSVEFEKDGQTWVQRVK